MTTSSGGVVMWSSRGELLQSRKGTELTPIGCLSEFCLITFLSCLSNVCL